MHFDLTVIIPTFNEEENIERMVLTVDTICKAHNITEEILVVDDNSYDNTITIVKSLMADHPFLHLIIRTRNRGFPHHFTMELSTLKRIWSSALTAIFHIPQKKFRFFTISSKRKDMIW